MATFVKIRNVNRTNLRIGTVNVPASNGAGAVAPAVQVDLDDRKVLRDLYRHVGRWVVVEDSAVKSAKVALSAGNIGAGTCFAWQNPEGQAILVHNVVIDVTTAGAATSVVNVGAAANATTSASTLISGGALSAIGVLNSGGKADKVASGAYITGSVATANATGLVGNAYVFYRAV